MFFIVFRQNRDYLSHNGDERLLRSMQSRGAFWAGPSQCFRRLPPPHGDADIHENIL